MLPTKLNLAPTLAPPCESVTRWLTFGLGLALFGLCLGWEWAWAPTGSGTLAIKALPLALALPGLFHGRLYTYRWLSLLVWLYVAEASVRGYGDLGLSRQLAWAEGLLSVLLFTACVLRIRCMKRPVVATS